MDWQADVGEEEEEEEEDEEEEEEDWNALAKRH